MKFTKTILAALFALSALNAQAAASVNLVVNGSFEDNLQAPGTWHIYNSLTGWTSGKYGIELRDNVAGKAKDGKNFVELDTTANSMMTQDIHIGNAGQYQLSFFMQLVQIMEGAISIPTDWNGALLESRAKFYQNGMRRTLPTGIRLLLQFLSTTLILAHKP